MRNIVTWGLSVLLASAFFAIGFAKLASAPSVASELGCLGLPAGCAYLSGVLAGVLEIAVAAAPRASHMVALAVAVLRGRGAGRDPLLALA